MQRVWVFGVLCVVDATHCCMRVCVRCACCYALLVALSRLYVLQLLCGCWSSLVGLQVCVPVINCKRDRPLQMGCSKDIAYVAAKT